MCFDEVKLELKFNVNTFVDTCCAVSIIQLQTAFCLLMLGYVMAFVCCVTEIRWHHYT